MSVNFSASSSDSIFLSYSLRFELDCLNYEPNSSIFTTFSINQILLLLPLCNLVLYHGLQRWWKQRSTSTAATSHSDTFTYHLATMELIHVFGIILCCCGIYSNNLEMLFVWFCLFCFVWYGETVFHILTCVEHYLAVVHPIIYLSLRKKRAIRIRHISIGCIWLFCCGGTIMMVLEKTSIVVDFCILISSLIIISFCSLSVLWVLVRPGPGERGRDRVRVDQSKLKAFYTIVAIWGVLLLRCLWNLVWTVLSVLKLDINECMWLTTEIWINLPGSLVLPLLFLHRAGMLPCCKNNIK